MKIAHISDHFHPWMGYQETYLAKEHTAMNHDVLVITSNRYGRRPGTIAGTREATTGFNNEEGIAVERLPVLFELPTVWAYPWISGLAKTLERFSPDIVHCHGITSFSNVRVAVLKHKYKFKLVIDNHNALFNVFHPRESRIKQILKSIIHKGYARTFGRILVRQADAIVAIGEPERDFVKWLFGSLAPEKIPIIRLGADAERFIFNETSRNRIRDEHGWDDQTIVLGHAGTISEKKGVVQLLEALKSLPENMRKRCKLNLVGKVSADFLPDLKERSAKVLNEGDLVITNFVDPSRLGDVMSAWDIAVWAGDISNTAIEAMSVNRPLIACKSPYTAYIVGKYNAGILVERDNIEDLAAGIFTLIKDQDLRETLGENARIAVEEDINWKKIAKDFIDLYKTIDASQEMPNG